MAGNAALAMPAGKRSVLKTHHLIRQVTFEDLDRCYAIERAAYAGDEAATREKIARRIREYPEGFILCEHEGVVAGFINCGATDDVDLASEAFKDLEGHDPAGKHVVVFSVAVHPAFQGRGFARQLLEAFAARMQAMGKHAIHLICRRRHIDFYAQYGFSYVQPSASQHGGRQWHEMVRELERP